MTQEDGSEECERPEEGEVKEGKRGGVSREACFYGGAFPHSLNPGGDRGVRGLSPKAEFVSEIGMRLSLFVSFNCDSLSEEW